MMPHRFRRMTKKSSNRPSFGQQLLNPLITSSNILFAEQRSFAAQQKTRNKIVAPPKPARLILHFHMLQSIGKHRIGI